MFRDIGLARISKDDLRMGQGTGRQEKDVRKMAGETGGEIIEMFIEDDTPASRFSTKERRKYARMVELLRSGARDRIVVWRLDRLLRIPRMLEDLIDLCEERPFLVLSVTGSLDLRTAEGRKYARDRVSDAAYESDVKSERLKRAFDEQAELGLAHAGYRAFGYACNGLRPCEGEGCCHDRPCEHRPRHKRCCRIPGCPHDGMTLIGPEAEVWRQGAMDMLAGAVTLKGLARRWNAAGFPTPNDYKDWDGASVKCTLINPRAAGLRVHRGEAVGKAAWEPIVDEVTHKRLVRLLTDPSRDRRLPSRRTPFTGLFTNIEGVRLLRNSDGKAVYRCPPGGPPGTFVQIVAEPLERLAVALLFEEVESGRVHERLAARRRARAEQQTAAENPDDIRAELVQLAEDKANPDIGLSREEWLAQRDVLTRRLKKAEEADEAPPDALALIDPDIRQRWAKPEDKGGYSDDRKGAILRAVFERIIVHRVGKRGPAVNHDRVEPIYKA